MSTPPTPSKAPDLRALPNGIGTLYDDQGERLGQVRVSDCGGSLQVGATRHKMSSLFLQRDFVKEKIRCTIRMADGSRVVMDSE